MECNISEPLKRDDVPDKISGKAKYVADIKMGDMLHARTLRSTKARALIKSIEYPILPSGYYIVDKRDVPGSNAVKMLKNDQPFFADSIVNYIGEPIALVVGEDREEVLKILRAIKIEYESMEPIFTMEESLNCRQPIFEKDNCFADYNFSKGDISDAKDKARYVFEGQYETGYQEQFYLEPQGVIGVYKDEKITIYGSIQCPYYVKGAVVECMGFTLDRVQIVQTITGGAFGGKEDYPSILAGQVACASYKTGRPVSLILDREEDLEATTKRHPSKIKLKSYLDENYMILGMEAIILLDGGAYAGLSEVVLQRTMFAAAGVYNIENLTVKGKAGATNKAVSGAFRGFGAPQAFFAIEMHMEHIAKEYNIDPLDFKMKNLVKAGDRSTTNGVYREKILLPKMVDRVLDMSRYKEKKCIFEKERKDGRLRGMGLSLFFHGGGFTGNGERDIIKSKVLLVKYPDDTVEILIANVEMGQGVGTTLRKIVAHTLNISPERIIFKNPDTDRVPDSGPTVASRTILIVGKLLKDAAEVLKLRWNDDKKVEVTMQYKYPEDFYFDADNFQGDAYTSYSWGVNAVEVELDPLTYESSITGVWAVFDIGNAIDERIVKGQIDGGIVQGLGYGGMEVMENKGGCFMQRTSADYAVPTSMDVPLIESELICELYERGPFGAKALGELTLIGAPAAYALAVENASGIKISKIPVRPEYLMEVARNV